MLKRKFSIRDKIETFSLSFETKELLESVGEDVTENNSFFVDSDNKRVWMKEKKPKIIEEINQQLVKKLNIENGKYIVSLYYPPDKKTNNLIIKEQKDNILHRVFISTISENPLITYNNAVGENIQMKEWEANKMPPMMGGMLTYEFDNSKIFTVVGKKGFRSIRKTKYVDKRYILVFDYIMSKKDLSDLSDGMVNLLKKKQPNIDKEEIDRALQELAS